MSPTKNWTLNLKKHIGSHPDILERIVSTDIFREDALRVRRWIHKHKPTSSGCALELIVLCKSGRHRSVAHASLLHHAIGLDPLVSDVRLQHLNEPEWDFARRNWCHRCSLCQLYPTVGYASDELKPFLDKTYALYNA